MIFSLELRTLKWKCRVGHVLDIFVMIICLGHDIFRIFFLPHQYLIELHLLSPYLLVYSLHHFLPPLTERLHTLYVRLYIFIFLVRLGVTRPREEPLHHLDQLPIDDLHLHYVFLVL